MNRSLIAAAVLLLATAGCGDSDDNGSDDPTDEPTGSAYVEKVNQLCVDLIDEVVPITGDGEAPEAKKYLKNRPKLAPVYAAFDAEVATVPAETDADQEAKEAVTAYLAWVNQTDAEFAAKAPSLNDAELSTAFTAFLADFEGSPERAAVLTLGIDCPAR